MAKNKFNVFIGAGSQTHERVHVRQVLYCLSTSAAPIVEYRFLIS